MDVIARSTIEEVVPSRSIQRVVAVSPEKRVSSRNAPADESKERVVPLEQIVPWAAVEFVIAVFAEQNIVSLTPPDDVVPDTRLQKIVPRPSINETIVRLKVELR